MPTVAHRRRSTRSRACSASNLPGRLQANLRAPIFARVSGYVKSWKVDIGDVVKAGEILAEIEAPDLDQQLLQARADLASAEASARLSEVTLGARADSAELECGLAAGRRPALGRSRKQAAPP